MRRGSFKRRLPRGRLDSKISPALLGVAMFLIVLVPALFYLFPGQLDLIKLNGPSLDPSSRLEIKSALDSLPAPLKETKAMATEGSNPGQDAAGNDPELLATVHIDKGLCQVHLENNGSSPLHQVRVMGQGRTLGIISLLDCDEKKILALSGSPNDIEVEALDNDGNKVSARAKYLSDSSQTFCSGSGGDTRLSTKSATKSDLLLSESEGSDAMISESAPSSLASEGETDTSGSPLMINLSVNRSDGRAGEIVGFVCTAKNIGPGELSDVRINCGGRISSTTYLTSGKELHLIGSFPIFNDTSLMAGVVASNSKGDLITNNTSLEVRLVSSQLNLVVSGPSRVHRGERVNLPIRIENSGEKDLTDVIVRDDEGLIGRIALLSAGSYESLNKSMTVNNSLNYMVSAVAKHPSGEEVYSSQSYSLEALSSSLQIQSSPEQVRIYPGEPAEVTWQINNSGEDTLYNIRLEGDGGQRILSELEPGMSVSVAAIYIKNQTTWINITATGRNVNGSETSGSGGVLLQAIRPAIVIKAMPSEVEACPGEEAEVNVLVSNSGDDTLYDVVLKQNGSTIASLGKLSPGEFRVINTKTEISGNCSIRFEALGVDSSGRRLSESASVKVDCVILAVKVFASVSPPAPSEGESCKITCAVANTGMIPLTNVFVISKTFGPLGSIDFLSPKRQATVVAEKIVTEDLQDTITAEGFTADRTSVRGSSALSIKIAPPEQMQELSRIEEPTTDGFQEVGTAWANITFGNTSQPFSLPVQEEAERAVSAKISKDLDSAATKQNNAIMDGISNLLRYVEKLLGLSDSEESSQERDDPISNSSRDFAPQGRGDGAGSRNYELSIEGVKGSEHGAITILDVNAMPSQPAANEPINVTVHIQSPEGVKSALVKYGLSDMPLTKTDMLGVARVYDCSLRLESGTVEDGYWSGMIPGRGAGTYMPLSVWISDGESTAEGGPYLIHWSSVNSVGTSRTVSSQPSGSGMLFIESSSVKGRGEVSITDTIQGSSLRFDEKIKGSGSISLESMRCIDRQGSLNNFTEKKDLVFTDGQLKGRKTVASPTFHGGLGASVTERFNLSHVDRSETSSVSSNNSVNNTLSYRTDQAFDGTWNIQTRYAKFFKKIKADQKYTGSFQTQKDIEFNDAKK
ncbi:MAG: hypothetical protein ACP5OU_01185 [Methanothrix sp.]